MQTLRRFRSALSVPYLRKKIMTLNMIFQQLSQELAVELISLINIWPAIWNIQFKQGLGIESCFSLT